MTDQVTGDNAHPHQKTLAAAQLIDRDMLYRRAAALLPTTDGAGVVFVGDTPESRGLEALLGRLATTHPFAWLALSTHTGIAARRDSARKAFVARSGIAFDPIKVESPLGNSLFRVQGALFDENAQHRPAPTDNSVRFLSAPGESLETVEIARILLEEATRGVRFQDMAGADACAVGLCRPFGVRIRSGRYSSVLPRGRIRLKVTTIHVV